VERESKENPQKMIRGKEKRARKSKEDRSRMKERAERQHRLIQLT
jgi:hypothetical protein